jgi:hypothetical protein
MSRALFPLLLSFAAAGASAEPAARSRNDSFGLLHNPLEDVLSNQDALMVVNEGRVVLERLSFALE